MTDTIEKLVAEMRKDAEHFTALWPAQVQTWADRLEALASGGVTLRRLHETLPSISTPKMHGDNLAIILCTAFDDGGDADDDTGWSEAAQAGYEEVIAAIQQHYDAAILSALEQGGAS